MNCLYVGTVPFFSHWLEIEDSAHGECGMFCLVVKLSFLSLRKRSGSCQFSFSMEIIFFNYFHSSGSWSGDPDVSGRYLAVNKRHYCV